MISRKLSHKLDELKKMIQDAVVSRVVEDFVDINTPLKQFTDAVHVPKGKLTQYTIFVVFFI
jgi:vinculin